ncbi:MAG: ROK family protein [Comamonadaceae bacterium]|nr:MAG: ROK family protein [Comamonadaceae bacterium]
MPENAPPAACVDIGGTKVAVSIADGNGIRGRVAEPTVREGTPDALSQQVLRLIGQSCTEAGIDRSALTAIGVASCGPFVMNKGLIELAAPNICGGLAISARGLPNNWRSAPLEAPLREAFSGSGATVRIENDGVAALQAERRWGALQGSDHCAYVTWSTGVGVGLCVGGQVLRGKNGNAGHAGHTFVIDNDDAICGCGNVGDLESLVSGSAIAQRFPDCGYEDAEALMTGAAKGDQLAVGIVDGLCRIMGRGLYNLVATLDLERISLGGSVFWHNRDYLLPRLQAEVSSHLPALTEGVVLVAAGLEDKVGDYAALALVD